MNKRSTRLIAALVCSICLMTPIVALAGGWVRLGSAQASEYKDIDTIMVRGNERFREVKIRVVNAPLHMDKMVVYFENGKWQNVPLRARFKAGSESRIIKLDGTKRRNIRKVTFWYESKSERKNSKVILLAR